MRTRLVISAFLVLAFVPLARADGLPLSDVGAPATVGEPGNRYVAVATPRGTVVEHLGSVVYSSRLLDGRFTVPVVALDRTSAGLSLDRSTLVLITPRRSFPRVRTTFMVLDAHNLRPRSKIVLRGDYSFDALSPDGSRMYLIHYESPRNPTLYEVRAYDLRTGRMLPQPVVDPTEADEQMRGYPITRVTSADGRFAYTLYDGAGKTPFVHALDTEQGKARCIDLDMLAGNRNLYALRFALEDGGSTLAVMDGARRLVAVDTRTYEPVAAVAPRHAASRSWPRIAGLSVLALLGVAAAFYGARRLVRDRSARGVRPGPERRSSHPAAGRDGA